MSSFSNVYEYESHFYAQEFVYKSRKHCL